MGDISTPEDKRITARRLFDQEVMLSAERGFRLCKLHDISLEGAKLDIAWPELFSNAKVELRIDLPHDNEIKTYRLPARVARVATNGTAVEFTELTNESRQALKNLLRSLT